MLREIIAPLVVIVIALGFILGEIYGAYSQKECVTDALAHNASFNEAKILCR